MQEYAEAPATTDYDEIALRAYYLYEARGAEDGQDLEDWLTAEQQLQAEREPAAEEEPVSEPVSA